MSLFIPDFISISMKHFTSRHNVYDYYNSIMVDQDPILRGEPQKLSDLKKENKKYLRDTSASLRKFRSSFDLEAVDPFAEFFFGSTKKEVVGADGKPQLVDYTVMDVVQAMNQEIKDNSDFTRVRMGEDIAFAMGHQWMYFRSGDSPLARDALFNVAIVNTLVNHFVDTQDNVQDPFPYKITEPFYMAEALETIRSTTLKPASYAYSGIGEDGLQIQFNIPSFEDDQNESEIRQRQDKITNELGVKNVSPEFRTREVEMMGESIESYSQLEWEKVVRQQQQFLLEYFQGLAQRRGKESDSWLYYLGTLLDDEGNYVHSDEQLRPFQDSEKAKAKIVRDLKEMHNISQLVEIVEQNLGESATLSDLLTMFCTDELQDIADNDFRG